MDKEIKFSKEYVKTLKNMLKVFNDVPDQRSTLFFKKDGLVHLTAMSMNTLVNVKTSEKHVGFADDEIGITSISEFINYLNAIDYGENDNAVIMNVEETSTKGNKLYSFLFKNRYGMYRMPIAHPELFDQKKSRRVPKDSNDDPLSLVGKFLLTATDTKLLVKNVNLMNKTDIFHLSVMDDKIVMYMKGLQNQQFSRTFDGMSIKIYDNFTTKTGDTNNLKIFSTKIFDYMSYFDTDFEIELRLTPEMNGQRIMAIKARGTLKVKDSDDICIYVGTQENSSDVCTTNLELVE